MNSLGFQHRQIIFVQDPEGTLGFLGTPFPACPWRGVGMTLPILFLLKRQLWEGSGGSGVVLAP